MQRYFGAAIVLGMILIHSAYSNALPQRAQQKTSSIQELSRNPFACNGELKPPPPKPSLRVSREIALSRIESLMEAYLKLNVLKAGSTKLNPTKPQYYNLYFLRRDTALFFKVLAAEGRAADLALIDRAARLFCPDSEPSFDIRPMQHTLFVTRESIVAREEERRVDQEEVQRESPFLQAYTYTIQKDPNRGHDILRGEVDYLFPADLRFAIAQLARVNPSAALAEVVDRNINLTPDTEIFATLIGIARAEIRQPSPRPQALSFISIYGNVSEDRRNLGTYIRRRGNGGTP